MYFSALLLPGSYLLCSCLACSCLHCCLLAVWRVAVQRVDALTSFVEMHYNTRPQITTHLSNLHKPQMHANAPSLQFEMHYNTRPQITTHLSNLHKPQMHSNAPSLQLLRCITTRVHRLPRIFETSTNRKCTQAPPQFSF